MGLPHISYSAKANMLKGGRGLYTWAWACEILSSLPKATSSPQGAQDAKEKEHSLC